MTESDEHVMERGVQMTRYTCIVFVAGQYMYKIYLQGKRSNLTYVGHQNSKMQSRRTRRETKAEGQPLYTKQRFISI